MSDDCLCKECAICGRIIHGGNYYCPNCKLCVCFTCGLNLPLFSEGEVSHACPACGNKMM